MKRLGIAFAVKGATWHAIVQETMKNKLRILLTLVALGTLLVSTPPVSAQTRQFKQELERFDRRFRQVEELVSAFGNRRARQLLQEASTLRNAAEEAFRARRLQEAQAKLKAAFTKLDLAEKQTLQGPVQRTRNRVLELLRQAEHEILNCNHPEAQRLLKEAKANIERAESALHTRRVRAGIERYRVAETQLNQALRLVRTLNEKVREERRRFEALLERAREVVERNPNSRAQETFKRALKLAADAEEAARACKLGLARRLYNQGTMLLVRAMDLAGGQGPEVVGEAEMAFYRLRELAEEATECVAESDDPRARKLLERARQQQREAERSMQKGRSHETLYKIGIAENLFRQACRIARARGGRPVSDRIRQQITNARSDVAALRSKLSPDSPRDVLNLARMADVSLRRAEEAAKAGFVRFALEAVWAAQRFVTRADRILQQRDAGAVEISTDAVRLKLRRLDQLIVEAEQEVEDAPDDWSRRFLGAAKQLRRFANQSLNQGNFRAADEAANIALEFVRKSLRGIKKP